ncbi:hypothetical protein V6N11_040478 [Hibiscus sabdariffa]|uniref:DCD domain-containing protein n=1 Tax=Hibiscus sabdariffa TaxID=183260 RepID=A0ABR2RHL5_9ROSI
MFLLITYQVSQDIPITNTLVDSTSFPSLQDSIEKTGRDRLDTGKDIDGSANKFAVLSDGDVPILEGRKPRVASQGVTNILNELKAKKKENVEKSKRSSAPIHSAAASHKLKDKGFARWRAWITFGSWEMIFEDNRRLEIISKDVNNNNNSSNENTNANNAVDKRFKTLPATETLPRNEVLGGYIFVCNNDTMQEDLKRQLFGLPPRYRDSVRAITPGLPLFLYNYTTHQLHGIFEAASFGGSNIDPTAWEDKKCKGESRFPAQVRIRIRKVCKALEEDAFRPVLHHYDGPKFRLELSVPETLDLLDLCEQAGSP